MQVKVLSSRCPDTKGSVNPIGASQDGVFPAQERGTAKGQLHTSEGGHPLGQVLWGMQPKPSEGVTQDHGGPPISVLSSVINLEVRVVNPWRQKRGCDPDTEGWVHGVECIPAVNGAVNGQILGPVAGEVTAELESRGQAKGTQVRGWPASEPGNSFVTRIASRHTCT